MAGIGVGGAVAIGSAVASAAGTGTKMVMDNNAQKSNIRRIKQQQRLNEQKQKNLLEEQLSRRRALVASMGVSSTGSVLSSQNKLIKDTYKNLAADNYNYDSSYAQSKNEYYSGMTSKIMGGVSNGLQMIK